MDPSFQMIELAVTKATPPRWQFWRKTQYHYMLKTADASISGICDDEVEAFQFLIEGMMEFGLPDPIIQMAMSQQMAAEKKAGGGE